MSDGGSRGSGTLEVLFAALEASPDAVGLACGGKVVRVNPSLARLLGYDSPAEMVGVEVASFTAPESLERIAQLFEEQGSEHVTAKQKDIIRFLRRDGSVVDVEATSSMLMVDGAACSLGILRDVSQQRRDADTLREREEFYRAMFEVNTAIKLLIDPADQSIVDANPAAAEFYGWPLDQLRRMKVSEINVLTEDEILAEMELARSRRRMAFHFRHRTADGRIRDVDVYSGPVNLRGRELLLSIIHDVTERNQLEDQLRRAHRLDAIGRLAAGIAHDFNNLLTVVMASAQIGERQLPPEHRVRTYLGDIRHAAQRGAELTRQLLAFARQQALAPVSIDLVVTLGRIAGMLERVLGDDVEVVREVPATLSRVRFDPGQLELALINVALNARDAMPDGGRLALRAGDVVDDAIGAAVLVTIEDTGAGMDAETAARVFEPFYTTKPPGQGTGLGLATVYGIVAQSGGRVAIDSTPGAGTRIHLWLPIDRPPVEPPAPEPSFTARCAARSVLVVDDRGDVLSVLGRALGEAGIAVHSATGARAAMAKLAELDGRVDVVLSDVSMPERSGIELAGDIHARWPRMPIVLMSGNPRAGAVPGVAAFLDKPFTLGDVLAVLDRAVRETTAD